MATLVFSTIVIMALLGAPIFAVFSLLALTAFHFAEIETSAVVIEMVRLAHHPSLLAIPVFTFAGYVLASRKVLIAYFVLHRPGLVGCQVGLLSLA